MPENGRQFGHDFGRQARQRMRFSSAVQAVRVLQENAARGVITPEQANLVSEVVIRGWALGQFREMIERQLDPSHAQVIYESSKSDREE